MLILHLLALRESVEKDASNLGKEVVELKEQIEALREKDRQNLEEIKTWVIWNRLSLFTDNRLSFRLLKDKVNLQTASIDQRERALEKERVFRYAVHTKDLGPFLADIHRW